jgi:hypothetical protein
MKRHISKFIAICGVIILILGYSDYKYITREIPLSQPKVVIKYNNKVVPVEIGEHNWINGEGGNSYLAGSSYDVGQKCSAFTAKANDILSIQFSSKPREMKVFLWSGYSANKIYKSFGAQMKYEFALPEAKGEYIFEVMGGWDDKHNTSSIFKVRIE